MRNLFLVLIIGLLLIGCDKKQEGYTISGTINNGAGKTLYVAELGVKRIKPIDSLVIAEDGSYSLSGYIDQPKFFVINIDDTEYIHLLVDSTDNIVLNSDASDFKKYSIEGSNDSRLIKTLKDEMFGVGLEFDRIQRELDQQLNSMGDDKDAEKDSLSKVGIEKTKELFIRHRNFRESLIRENISSLVCLMILYQPVAVTYPKLNSIPIFYPSAELDLFKQVRDSILVKYPKSIHAKELQAQIIQYDKQLQLQEEKEASFKENDEAPEISLSSPDGNEISLSSLRGKYVLLDFWASWCRPCRIENPNLVANYQKYKDKGLEIYQVSLDKTKEDWTKAIKADNLNWIHVSDLSYWDSPIVKLYKISGIPTNHLLDPEGKIIASNLRGPALGAKLEEVFSE